MKYCEDIGISAQKASKLFIFIGLASCVARLMTGRLCNNKRVNPVYVYQSCMVTAGVAAFLLPFTTKYWNLIVFSVVYGLSDGVFITIKCLILLTVVDSKRTTAAFCIHNVVYSFSAAAGGPVAGELILLFHPSARIVPGEIRREVLTGNTIRFECTKGHLVLPIWLGTNYNPGRDQENFAIMITGDDLVPGEVLDISLGGEVRRGPSYPDPV